MDRQDRVIFPLGILTVFLVVGTVASAAESQQARSQQAERGKGLTVEDLTRGVRSAVRNIENEIPKMGAAVGKAVKSIGSNNSDKASPPRQQPSDKK